MRIGVSIRLFTPNTGGLQWHAQRLVENLEDRGHEIRILTKTVTTAYPGSFWFRDPSSAKLRPGLQLLRPRPWAFPILRVAQEMRRRKPTRAAAIGIYERLFRDDAVRCFQGCSVIHHIGQGTEMIGFAAEKAARTLNVPFTISPTIHPGHWGDSDTDFRLYRRADRLLAFTNYEREYFVNKGVRSPIDVVGNGIDDPIGGDGERFRAKHGIEGPMILFLGRKDPDKGYDVLQQAHALMRQPSTLVCIGPDHGERGQLSRGSRPVIDLGFVPEAEKQDALAACDIFCLPSLGESFGLVYMEAGRYRKPIVCRPIPVLEELLDGAAVFVGERVRECGGRLEAEDLAAALDSLLVDAGRRKALGEKAFAASEKFVWPKVTANFIHAYEKAIAT